MQCGQAHAEPRGEVTEAIDGSQSRREVEGAAATPGSERGLNSAVRRRRRDRGALQNEGLARGHGVQRDAEREPFRERNAVAGPCVEAIPALDDRLRLDRLSERRGARERESGEAQTLALEAPEAERELLTSLTDLVGGDFGRRVARGESQEDAERRGHGVEPARGDPRVAEGEGPELRRIDRPGLVPPAEARDGEAVEVDGECEPVSIETDDARGIQEWRGAVDCEGGAGIPHEGRATAERHAEGVPLSPRGGGTPEKGADQNSGGKEAPDPPRSAAHRALYPVHKNSERTVRSPWFTQ